jgi:hypothetical protein
MLTREHGICAFDRDRQAHPDRLHRQRHAAYLELADRMLAVYRAGAGQPRRVLHRRIEALFDNVEDCPPRRISAFCKLLDDVATFDRDRSGKARKLRMRVLNHAAGRHPLVADQPLGVFEHARTVVRAELAAELGLTWEAIEERYFADIIELQPLQSFAGYPCGADLLARYNVAQTQVALFDAVRMRVTASRDFKAVLRQAKLAGLLHTIERHGASGYTLLFDGPASVLRETRRYGAAMARFIPALLACAGWSLEARLAPKQWPVQVTLRLSPDDGLRSPVAPDSAYDSTVEEVFAAKWGAGERDGWRLLREGDILHRGQRVFVPDFLLRHTDGREACLEIVGFWTEDYWQRKLETLAVFADRPIILAVPKHLLPRLGDTPFPVIPYATSLKLAPVLEALAARAQG